MAELIDKEKLISAICIACANGTIEIKGCESDDCNLINLVDNQPTIEAEPVRYGRWEMADLIDRDALWIDLQSDCSESDVCTSGKPCIECIVNRQPAVNRWIPCSERLPESREDVLVWFEYFRYGEYNCMYRTYNIGNYFPQYGDWMVGHETGWRKLKVLAWMPLPEPPESEVQK